MMTDQIVTLNRVKEMRTTDEVLLFEKTLEEIANQPDLVSLEELHLILSDSCNQIEVMWGLLHLLESYDVEKQLTAFLNVIPQLVNKSPEWTKIIHFRILNDPPSLEVFKRCLEKSDPEVQKVEEQILHELKNSEKGDLQKGAASILSFMKRAK